MAKPFWDRLTPIEKKAIEQGKSLLGEIRDKITGEERPGASDRNLVAGLRLRELREARQISQEELAERLERTQSAVSQIEKRGDLLLSTLVQYVAATGGEVAHFTVRYPEGDVEIAPVEARERD